MKILYLADGRSPTAIHWIKYFVDQSHSCHLVSLFPCQPDIKLASLKINPLRFSGAIGNRQAEDGVKTKFLKRMAPPKLRTWIRQRFVPGSIPKAVPSLHSLIQELKPDIVHAMRIPYEGMLTAITITMSRLTDFPFLISVWGNDFTLHAPATKYLTRLTKLTLQTADGLHTDCKRDQVYAKAWGFNKEQKIAVVLPGAGGIQLDRFYPPDKKPGRVIINPRGMRAYIRNDTFFKSIPMVLEKYPDAKFICPNMADQHEALGWVEKLGIQAPTELLPLQERDEMANLFRKARIVVSPSEHDGTPNTLLEAMACGCTPIAGDIDTIREWIIPGFNGLVFDPSDPKDLAEMICLAMENHELLARAKRGNRSLIEERAEYSATMREAEKFYQDLIRIKKNQSSR